MLSLFKKQPDRVFKTESGDVVFGMMAEFDTPGALAHAAEAVRDAGYTKWDVYSPFPVHGMEECMGLKDSRLGLIAGVVGLSGAAAGFFLQFGISNFLYNTTVQGKDSFAWESYVPITFEIGVLTTAFTVIGGMFLMNRLPMFYHPLLKKDRFLRVSDDRFVIAIEASDERFDPASTRSLLESAAGHHIDLVEE